MAAAFRILYFPPATSHLSHTYLPLPHNRLPLSRPRNSIFHLFLSAVPLRALPTIQSESNSVELEEEELSKTRLLVQNVPWTSTEDDLRSLFQNYGTVVEIEFSMYNKERNRGLAFVTMASPEEALAAFNSLESSEFGGRVLKLNWAKPKKPKSAFPQQPKPLPVHNLFVTFLPFQARSKDLKEFFIANGANVISAEIIYRDNPRRSAGYGFVSFNTKAEADAALSAFQGKEFMGRTIRVAPSKRFLRPETKAAIESKTQTETEKHEETPSTEV